MRGTEPGLIPGLYMKPGLNAWNGLNRWPGLIFGLSQVLEQKLVGAGSSKYMACIKFISTKAKI